MSDGNILDRLSPIQRTRLAAMEETRREMFQMRLDGLADKMIAKAEGFLLGALNLDLSEGAVKVLLRDAHRREYAG